MTQCYKCNTPCDKLCDTTHTVIMVEENRQYKRIFCDDCYFSKIQKVLKDANIVFDSETKLVLCNDGSFEPYEYYVWTDSFKLDRGHETCKAAPPKAHFNSNKQLWQLDYTAKDSGGYGVGHFVKYFKDQKSILKFLCN